MLKESMVIATPPPSGVLNRSEQGTHEPTLRLIPYLKRHLMRHRCVLGLLFLTVVLSFGWFLIDGNVGINLADEGYLWYGLRALRAGLIPIRDFHAYDPGRYFWVAGWSMFLGQGLVSMRAACVAFQCIG